MLYSAVYEERLNEKMNLPTTLAYQSLYLFSKKASFKIKWLFQLSRKRKSFRFGPDSNSS